MIRIDAHNVRSERALEPVYWIGDRLSSLLTARGYGQFPINVSEKLNSSLTHEYIESYSFKRRKWIMERVFNDTHG